MDSCKPTPAARAHLTRATDGTGYFLWRLGGNDASGSTYFNFAGFLEGGEVPLAQTFGANYPRIREIKAKYDPENIFHHNLRIPVSQAAQRERV